MIINTGQRTDIPAFYAEWLAGRLREGFVCVRNPYDPNQVSRYRLDPSVVPLLRYRSLQYLQASVQILLCQRGVAGGNG